MGGLRGVYIELKNIAEYFGMAAIYQSNIANADSEMCLLRSVSSSFLAGWFAR